MNLFTKDINELREAKKLKYNRGLKNIDVEDILHRIQLHSVKTDLDRVRISQQQFLTLCVKVRELVMKQPALLKLDGPIYVCSGTLGNYQQLANIIDKCHHPKFISYLFLGDYTGRYLQSVECLVAVFAYKLFMPNNFFILRGVYQTIAMTKAYNLYDELQDFFQSSLPWIEACQTFSSLPYAAVIEQKILCVHGGISPYLQSIDQINSIPRPMDAADKQLTCDLLWADPTNLYEGWTQNDRGFGVSFGSDVVASFLKANDLTLLCRSNQVAYEGFKFNFDKKCVTLTSLANYCQQTNNSSAVMKVDENSNVLFKIITEKNNYTQDQQQGLTFVDMVRKKKERQKKFEKKMQQKAKREQQKMNQKINKAKYGKKIIKQIKQKE